MNDKLSLLKSHIHGYAGLAIGGGSGDSPVAMLKSHVNSYTRKDGAVVQAHDDKRVKKATDMVGFHASAHAAHEAAAAKATAEYAKPFDPLNKQEDDAHGKAYKDMHAHGHAANAHKTALAHHKAGTKEADFYSKQADSASKAAGEVAASPAADKPSKILLASQQSGDKAKPAGNPPLSQQKVNAVTDDHPFTRKAGDWKHEGADAVPADAVKDWPEFTHKEVYGHDDVSKTSPVGTDFHKDFAAKKHQGFVMKHPDGSRHAVDTQGSDYARYSAPVAKEEAATPDGGQDDAALNAQHDAEAAPEEDDMTDGDREAEAQAKELRAKSEAAGGSAAAKPAAKKPKNDPAALRAAGDAMRAGMDKNAADKKSAGQPEGFVPRKDTTDAPPQADANEKGWDALPDEQNPKHSLSGMSSNSLGKVARGESDLNDHAHRELANRGMDSDGNWVGFKDAAEHHKEAIGKIAGHKAPDAFSDPDGDTLSRVHTKVLSAAAKGHLDLNKRAKTALAGRGHDSNAKWVGFKEAEKHHFGAGDEKPGDLKKAEGDPVDLLKSHINAYTTGGKQ